MKELTSKDAANDPAIAADSATPGRSSPTARRYGGRSGKQNKPAPPANIAKRLQLKQGPDTGFNELAPLDHIHSAAAAATQGSGQALPFGDEIQRAFGRHDVSDVRAHVGGTATDACDDMGAIAFASGNDVAFRGAPDLHTAAHETAHVVQQRGGVSLKGGVGQQNDRYEQHADQVADAVVAGHSAESILDEMAGDGGAAAGVVQHKKLSDDQVYLIFTKMKQALSGMHVQYTGIESNAHRTAIHKLATAARGGDSAALRERKLTQAQVELHEVTSQLSDKQKATYNQQLAQVKAAIGAAKAEEAVPTPTGAERREEMEKGPAITEAKLAELSSPAAAAKKAREGLKKTFKQIELFIAAAKVPAGEFESAFRIRRVTSDPIELKSADGQTISKFDPKGVGSVADLAGSGIGFYTAIIDKLDAEAKLDEKGHDEWERGAAHIAQTKAVADATKSMVELSLHATEVAASLSGNDELLKKVAALKDGPGLKFIGGALLVADVVGNLCVLNSSTASTADKEDAAAGLVIGAAKLAEWGGAAGAGPVVIALELTWLVLKWSTANYWKVRTGITNLAISTAYKELAAHTNALQAELVRLNAVAQLMEAEPDLDVRAGMLTRWDEVADTIGGDIRRLCSITESDNDLDAPGQFIQTIVPHFAPMRQKYGDVGGGAEAVKAVPDVLETVKDAFDKQQHYADVEAGAAELDGINWPVGSFCHAEWNGEYYPATIREVNKAARSVKLTWDGYTADADDNWYHVSKLINPVEYCEGDKVEVEWEGQWYKATVVDDDGRTVTVNWRGYPGESEVSHAQVRIDNTPGPDDWCPGDQVEALWEGKWYPVIILTIDFDMEEAEVHWVGFSDEWNCYVPFSDMR